MARYYYTREEKIIAAAILLGLSTLAGLIGYFAGYHVGKNKEVVMALETDPIPVQTPVVPAEAQAEDTVQMTPEQIKEEGMPINPGDNPAEKIGFEPKKTKRYKAVDPDTTDHLGKDEVFHSKRFSATPKNIVKVYEIVESTNDGRTQ